MYPQVKLYDDVLKNRWSGMVYKKDSEFSQWTPEERYTFLKKLIMLSSSDERLKFYNFFKTVVPVTSIDFTRILPRTISLYIFSFLDPRSLCRACQVSHYWRILCESNSIWGPKCLSLGWQLPNNKSKPDFGAYKRLYIENIKSFRLELRKIRRKIALDQQRAEEENRNKFASRDVKQRRLSARKADNVQISKISVKSTKAKTFSKYIETPKFAERKSSTNAEKMHPRIDSSRSVERNSEKQKSMKERIADVTERLSAPLERRRRNSISHSPIQNITRDETIRKQRQSSLPRRKVKLPASMIVAPPGQRFTPLPPELVKVLPSPPVYKPKTELDENRKRNWTKKQQEIFEYVKDIPS